MWEVAGDAVGWIKWDWSWSNFWAEFVAGLATFALGLIAAWFFFFREIQAGRQKDFELFQNLAREVRADLEDARSALLHWRQQTNSGDALDQVAEIPLTWVLGDAYVRLIFATHALQRDTQTAVTWYKRAVEVARVWNEEYSAGKVTDETRSAAAVRIGGAIPFIETAIERLSEVAKLPALPPST